MNLLEVELCDILLPMATRYKSVEAAELVPLESFQSDQVGKASKEI